MKDEVDKEAVFIVTILATLLFPSNMERRRGCTNAHGAEMVSGRCEDLAAEDSVRQAHKLMAKVNEWRGSENSGSVG